MVASQNCGLAVFGTNSEANSLSVEERSTARRLVAAGSRSVTHDAGHRLLLAHGNGAAHIAGGKTRLRRRANASAVLLQRRQRRRPLPHFSEVVQRVGDARLRIYLYHIPPVAVVGITPGLVERLLKSYPNASPA